MATQVSWLLFKVLEQGPVRFLYFLSSLFLSSFFSIYSFSISSNVNTCHPHNCPPPLQLQPSKMSLTLYYLLPYFIQPVLPFLHSTHIIVSQPYFWFLVIYSFFFGSLQLPPNSYTYFRFKDIYHSGVFWFFSLDLKMNFFQYVSRRAIFVFTLTLSRVLSWA